MYMDSMVLAGVVTLAAVILFAACFALFIWLDMGNDEDV